MDRMRKKFLLRVLSLMLAFGVAWHLGLTSVSYGELTQGKNHIKAYEALADDTQVNKYPVKEELPGHKVLATNSNSPFWQSSNKTAVAEAEVVTLTEVPIPEMLTNTDEMVIVGEPEGGEILEANTGTSPDTPEAEPGTSTDTTETEPGTSTDTTETEPGTNQDTPEANLESESINKIAPESGIDTDTTNLETTAETGGTVSAFTVDVNSFTNLKNAIAAGGDSVIVLTGNIIADSVIVIPSDSNITLDMNGYSITTTKMLFSLNNPTSALTITDSRQGAETTQTVSGDNYGNHATTAIASGKITLDYYVTKTTVTNSSTGATAETLEKHSVTSSAIISNSYTASIISVSAGTFNMTGGMLYGGKQAAISQTGGTSNLSGGYICGVDGGYYNISGAAVNQTGGTLNISGSAVLAGNTASIGGAVYSSTGTVNISGGIISGNTAEEDGGGVYLSNSSIATMSGGYITNNEAQGNSWYRGGGGVYVNDSAFTLNGGFITGNKAIGGGGISTSYNTSVIASSTTNEGRVYITGGFVTANVATANEGGGLCVRDGYYSEISGGHITNNITQTTDDWGGGGIFIGETGMVEIKSLLMTENTARYYGGGVGSCSTGNMYLFVEEGAAIYDNTAIGDEPIGNGAKPYDRWYTVGNTVSQVLKVGVNSPSG